MSRDECGLMRVAFDRKIEVFAECGFVDSGIEYMGQIEFYALKWCVRTVKYNALSFRRLNGSVPRSKQNHFDGFILIYINRIKK